MAIVFSFPARYFTGSDGTQSISAILVCQQFLMLHPQQLSAVERGMRPTRALLERLATALEVTPEMLTAQWPAPSRQHPA